jgi:hypothetical protein
MAERRFTDLELERQLAGDLPADRGFDQQATDADRARLAELRGEQEAFLRSVDVDNEVLRIQQRVARAAKAPRATIHDTGARAAPEPRKAWWKWLVPAGALAAATAVLLVFLRRGDGPTKPDDELQVKGDEISLVVHVQTGDTSRRIASGDDVLPGDKLRFEINAGKAGYVAIVGIDGTGALTVYYPESGNRPIAFDPKARLLPGAIALDATPGDERFFAIYAEQPFVLDTVLPAIEKNQPLPAHMSKAEVVLNKKVPQ